MLWDLYWLYILTIKDAQLAMFEEQQCFKNLLKSCGSGFLGPQNDAID